MRPTALAIPQPHGTPSDAGPAPAPARRAAPRQLEPPKLTLAGLGFIVYLWVVHSYRLPIAAAAIIAGLIGVLFQRERLRVPVPWIWFGGFLLWALIGYASAASPTVTWTTLVGYTKVWLIFLLAANVAHSRGQLRWMMIAWLGLFALYPVRGTLFNMAFGITTQGRYAWNFIFNNPNDLTTLTLPILALSVAMLQYRPERWVRWASLAGVVLLPSMILATQSRGGILALITFGSLVLLQYRKRAGALLLAGMIMIVVVQLAPEGVWGRLAALRKVTSAETIGQADVGGSAEQRSDIWRVATAIIRDHPVFGVGLGGYAQVHQRYARTGRFRGYVNGPRDAHSTYIRSAAETGIPGLLLLLGMLASVFVAGWRAVKRLTRVDRQAAMGLKTMLFGLIAFLQACLFASMDHLPHLYIYIAVIMTFIAVHQAPAPTPAGAPAEPRGRRRRG